MLTVDVALGERSYPIHVGSGISLPPDRCWLRSLRAGVR
jgi:hypothetical protein